MEPAQRSARRPLEKRHGDVYEAISGLIASENEAILLLREAILGYNHLR